MCKAAPFEKPAYMINSGHMPIRYVMVSFQIDRILHDVITSTIVGPTTCANVATLHEIAMMCVGIQVVCLSWPLDLSRRRLLWPGGRPEKRVWRAVKARRAGCGHWFGHSPVFAS